MKRHFLGFLIFIVAFISSLLFSPIRFEGTAMGHGFVQNGGGFYWIHGYRSMYFVGLSNEGEQYETPEKAEEVFQKRLEKPESEEIVNQEVLERNEVRAILYFQRKDGLKGYCIFRVEENGLNNICSPSLWHVLEFEKQNYQ